MDSALMWNPEWFYVASSEEGKNCYLERTGLTKTLRAYMTREVFGGASLCPVTSRSY
jgi:hypothetical protein